MSTSDDAKKAILARRAKFIAAAVAGINIACGKEPAPPPQQCLSVVDVSDASPMPCLTTTAPPPPPPTPSDDAGATPTHAKTPDAASTPPHPCLSVTPPQPQPHPCLTPKRPDK